MPLALTVAERIAAVPAARRAEGRWSCAACAADYDGPRPPERCRHCGATGFEYLEPLAGYRDTVNPPGTVSKRRLGGSGRVCSSCGLPITRFSASGRCRSCARRGAHAGPRSSPMPRRPRKEPPCPTTP